MEDEPSKPIFHLLHTKPDHFGELAVATGMKMLVLSHITTLTAPHINEARISSAVLALAE